MENGAGWGFPPKSATVNYPWLVVTQDTEPNYCQVER